MENERRYPINLSAPNLVNICVDKRCNNELSGKLYHCYAEEAVAFSNVVELVTNIDQLFDSISFPQASTKSRSFVESEEKGRTPRPTKVIGQEKIVQHTGNLGTFITLVKFRQNSTWQGEFLWKEKSVRKPFSNTLDFIKLLDNALASAM